MRHDFEIKAIRDTYVARQSELQARRRVAAIITIAGLAFVAWAVFR
jgi:hypothetical protein